MPAKHYIAEPKRQAVNQDGLAILLICGNRVCKIQRAFDRLPTRRTIRPMPGNPFDHLGIERLRRRQVNQRAFVLLGKALRKAAFS